MEMVKIIEVDSKSVFHCIHTLGPSKGEKVLTSQVQVTGSALGILLIFKYIVSQINR